MKAIIQRPFYPLLIAIYPIVYLAARNFTVIALADPIRPLLLTLGISAGLFLAFRLVLKDWHRAGLLATLVMFLFFSYGHVANQLPGISQGLLGAAWLGLFLLFSFLILRWRAAHNLAAPLNLASLALLAVALVSILQLQAWRRQAQNREREAQAWLSDLRGEASAEEDVFSPSPAPDIYLIILDSYERADALQKYYSFDNAPFLRALQKRGFYVADQSRSNYLTTAYSIPSELNLVYLNDLPHDVFAQVISGLRINHVADFLDARGYQVVHFPSGFGITDSVTADVRAAPEGRHEELPAQSQGLSQFEVLLLQTTMLRVAGSPSAGDKDLTAPAVSEALNQNFNARRAWIENAFVHIPDYAANERADFVFAHFILPHNPYLYDADGTPLEYNGQAFLLGDKANPQNNIRLYASQLQYTNVRVLELVDKILQNSAVPPVIILQADHGHDTFFEFEAPTPEGVDLRSAIFYAVYFPDGDYRVLSPTISPVNTFRVVFNQFFGAAYPILPDLSYLHPRADSNPLKSVQQFTPIEPYLEQLR